jgi:Skp family chaperone for outer membrane proteins
MPTTSTARTNRLAVTLIATLLILVGYQAFAMRPQAQLAPAVVATVDLEKVYNSLDAKTESDKEVQVLFDELNAEYGKKGDQIKQMQADLADLAPGGPKHKELQDQIWLETERYRGLNELISAKVDAERSRTMKRLYLNIRAAVEEMAQTNGYDVVLVNDSISEIPPGTVEDMTRQISARRVIYANKRVDITAAVIAFMNEAAKNPAG